MQCPHAVTPFLALDFAGLLRLSHLRKWFHLICPTRFTSWTFSKPKMLFSSASISCMSRRFKRSRFHPDDLFRPQFWVPASKRFSSSLNLQCFSRHSSEFLERDNRKWYEAPFSVGSYFPDCWRRDERSNVLRLSFFNILNETIHLSSVAIRGQISKLSNSEHNFRMVSPHVTVFLVVMQSQFLILNNEEQDTTFSYWHLEVHCCMFYRFVPSKNGEKGEVKNTSYE
jgi:hypothetical protein